MVHIFNAKTIIMQSYVQQNIEQTQTPTMELTTNKKSTATEPLP